MKRGVAEVRNVSLAWKQMGVTGGKCIAEQIFGTLRYLDLDLPRPDSCIDVEWKVNCS